MSGRSTPSRKALFADACLLGAGAYAVTTAIGGAIVGLALRGAPNPVVEAVFGPGGILATLLFGAVGAWLLNGRKLTGKAALGMLLGLVAGAVTGVALGALLPLLLIGVVRPLAGERGELWGLLVVTGIAGVAFLAMVATVAAGALRDLRSAAPAHVRLDRYRLVCAALVVLFTAVIGVLMAIDSKSEIGEALPFGVLFVLPAGFMALGADVATRGWKGGSPGGGTAESDQVSAAS